MRMKLNLLYHYIYCHISVGTYIQQKTVDTWRICSLMIWFLQIECLQLEMLWDCIAHLKIPAFTRGKQQLHQHDVTYSGRLAAVEIHVEWVISLVRNEFTILQSTIPISLSQCAAPGELISLYKMVSVCSALCNICPAVVSCNSMGVKLCYLIKNSIKM